MKQTAQVTRVISPGSVEVKVRRQSACASAHNCGSCEGCALMVNAPEVLIVAEDDHGAAAGDTVVVETETAVVLWAAALLYLGPFLLGIAFYCVGNALGWDPTRSSLLGVGGFLLVLLAAKLVDRHFRAKPIRYRVTAVVG